MEHLRPAPTSSGGTNPSPNPPRARARLARAILRDLREHGAAYAARKTCSTLARHYQFARYRFNLRRLTRDLDAVRIDRPLFILGVQGGGGTLLSRCMQRNPRIVYASGNARVWSGPDEIHNSPHLRDMPEPLVHRSYHFHTVNATVRHHPRYGYQRAWLYAIDEFLPEYAKTADDADAATGQRLRRVLAKLILAYATDPDDCRILDKSQLFTIQVPYLARLLRDANPHFVLLARDPYAACTRAVAKEYGPERGGYIADDLATRIRCAVEHWSNSYRLALDAAPDVPLLVVRYEDFLREPAPALRRICDFAGLDFDERQIPAAGQRFPLCFPRDPKWFPIKPEENARYLERLDPRLVAGLNERARDVIERLGYPIRD